MKRESSKTNYYERLLPHLTKRYKLSGEAQPEMWTETRPEMGPKCVDRNCAVTNQNILRHISNAGRFIDMRAATGLCHGNTPHFGPRTAPADADNVDAKGAGQSRMQTKSVLYVQGLARHGPPNAVPICSEFRRQQISATPAIRFVGMGYTDISVVVWADPLYCQIATMVSKPTYLELCQGPL